MKCSLIAANFAAIVLISAPSVLMADDYDCGTEQAAIRQRTHEIEAKAKAKKVNNQNGCAYQRELAYLTERQAAFLLNCYQGLKLTKQQAEDSALLLGVSAKNMRTQCAHTK